MLLREYWAKDLEPWALDFFFNHNCHKLISIYFTETLSYLNYLFNKQRIPAFFSSSSLIPKKICMFELKKEKNLKKEKEKKTKDKGEKRG